MTLISVHWQLLWRFKKQINRGHETDTDDQNVVPNGTNSSFRKRQDQKAHQEVSKRDQYLIDDTQKAISVHITKEEDCVESYSESTDDKTINSEEETLEELDFTGLQSDAKNLPVGTQTDLFPKFKPGIAEEGGLFPLIDFSQFNSESVSYIPLRHSGN